MRPAGIRARTTLLTAVLLALGLAAGSAALATVFARGRVATLDVRLREQSALLEQLIDSGQLPSSLPVTPGTSAQVVDAAQRVLAAGAGTSPVLPLLPGATPGLRTTSRSTAGDVPLRVLVRAVHDGGEPVTVVVALPLTDVEEAVRGLRRSVLVVVPLVVAAGGLATWLAVGAALRPVDRLRAAADAVLDVRTPAPPELPVPASGDELQRLSETLNAMLGRLHTSDARQRAFVADAAHELRSPLASLLVQLEVADAGPGSADLLAGALVDAERLRRLVEDLLLLARLDSGDPRPPARVDLADWADEHPGRPVPVLADPLALRRAVDNLQANARRHARGRVLTTVRVEGDVDGDWAVLSVEDDGAGIPVAERERVFERWARLDDGRGRDAGGAGLGLAIARAVAEGAGGRLTAGESRWAGARLELSLPLRE